MLVACLALLGAAAPSAFARDGDGPTAFAAAGKVTAVKSLASGAKRLTYRIGPFNIKPGQNDIGFAPIVERPQVNGWITRMRPDLVYLDGTVPSVDVIHLHHGVWLNLGRQDSTSGFPERFLAAGEEKTIVRFPKPYAYPYKPSEPWLLNHMIHNLTPVPTRLYMEYEIDFIPAGSRAARGLRPVRPIWMDVQNGSAYPVFDVEKGSGSGGRYTYPNDAGNPYGTGPKKNEWVVDRPGVLVATAGHLHPGRAPHRPVGEARRREHQAGPLRAGARRPPSGAAAAATLRWASATGRTWRARRRSTTSRRAPSRGTSR